MASSARIEELKKKFDENPRRYFAPLANEYRKAGDLEAAIAICRAHLPQQPGHMSGHIVFGQTLYEAGQLEEAGTIFQTALELDPENLIALRHLGDIARGLGDDAAARTWYSRVLEADPRNEEISGLLASLEGGASTRPSTTAEIVPPIASADAPSVGGSGTQLLDLADLHDMEAPPAAPAPEAARDADLEPIPETTDTWAIPSRSAEPAAAATPSEAFGSGGEEPRELELPAAPPAPPAPVRVSGESILPAQPDASGVEPLAGFEATEFQAPPAAATPGTLPGLEGMADWATKADEPAPAPAAAPTEPAGALPIVTETMAELLLSQGHRQQALAVYRQLVEQRPGDQVLAHRLAELERQGGPTIRQLLSAVAAWRPGHPAADPMGAVEAQAEYAPPPESVGVAPQPEAPTWQPEPTPQPQAPSWEPEPSPQPIPDGGQFASALLAPPAPEAPAPEPEPTPAPEPEREPEPEPAYEPPPAAPSRTSGTFVLDESYVPPEQEPVAAQSPNGGEPRETPAAAPRGGSIDRLFGGVKASDSDVRAAHALAAAFGSAPAAGSVEEEAGIRGEPARRASTDFSLDQIFRPGAGGASPKPAEGRAFSFDQFFGSAGGGTRPATAAEEPKQQADDTDDIQQFNSWLQGLKKR